MMEIESTELNPHPAGHAAAADATRDRGAAAENSAMATMTHSAALPLALAGAAIGDERLSCI